MSKTKAPKKLTVELQITKTGIERGVPGDGDSCPIARAMRAKGFKNVNIEGLVSGEKYGHEYTATSKDEMLKFINAFDNGKKVTPRKFKVVLEDNGPIESKDFDDWDGYWN